MGCGVEEGIQLPLFLLRTSDNPNLLSSCSFTYKLPLPHSIFSYKLPQVIEILKDLK